MTNLPPWMKLADTLEERLGAGTFEAHRKREDVKNEIDWFVEHNDFQSLRQIQEYLNEKMPRKDAA